MVSEVHKMSGKRTALRGDDRPGFHRDGKHSRARHRARRIGRKVMTRILKTVLLCLAAVLMAAGLAGSSASAGVGQKDKITCMYPVWVGFGPVHLANELGY